MYFLYENRSISFPINLTEEQNKKTFRLTSKALQLFEKV